MDLKISIDDHITRDEVILLYKNNGWSSADKPDELIMALENSHLIVTARVSGKLVGLANAISDGYLVVYYPHLLVDPLFHRKGIGRAMMKFMHAKYSSFHQQILVADGKAIDFYASMGFRRAGKTESMWIYQVKDH